MSEERTSGEDAFRRALRAELIVDAVLGAVAAVAVSATQLGLAKVVLLAVPALLLLVMLVVSLRLMADISDPTSGELRLLGGQRVNFALHRVRARLGQGYGVALLVVLLVSAVSRLMSLADGPGTTSLLFGVAWTTAVLLLVLLLLRVRGATGRLLAVQAELLSGDLAAAQRRGARVLSAPGPPQLEAWRRRLKARLAWLSGQAGEAERLWSEDWDGAMSERACALVVSRLERGDEALAETWLRDFTTEGPYHDHLRRVVRTRLAIRRREVELATGLLEAPELLTQAELHEAQTLHAAVVHLTGRTSAARELLSRRAPGIEAPLASEPTLGAVLADIREGRASGPAPAASAPVATPRGQASKLMDDPFATGDAEVNQRRDPSKPWARGVVPVDFAGAVQRRSRVATAAIVLLVSLLVPLAGLLSLGALVGDGMPGAVGPFGASAGVLGLGMVCALVLEAWVLWRQSGRLVLGDGVQLRDLGPTGWRVWAGVRLGVLFVPIGVFLGSTLALGAGPALGGGLALVLAVAAVLLGRRAGRYLALCYSAHTDTPQEVLGAADLLEGTPLGRSVGVRSWRGLALLFSGRSEDAEQVLNGVAQLLPEAGLLASWAQVGRKTVSTEGLARGGWPSGLGARYRRHVLMVLVSVTEGRAHDVTEALEVADALPNRWGALLTALCALQVSPDEGAALLRRRRSASDALALVVAAWPHLSRRVEALRDAA